MKIVFAVIPNDAAASVQSALTERGNLLCRLSAEGGFLRPGSAAFVCVADDERAEEVVALIKERAADSAARPTVTPTFGVGNGENGANKVEKGKGAVFVLNAERFEKV